MSEWELVIDGSMDVFDSLVANRQVLLDAEVRELALIAQACDEYAVDETRTEAAAEKLISGGGEGTPLVGEFLALELAGLLRLSPDAALLRIRETLELRHRHPQLWVHTHNGLLRPWQALKVVEACRRAHLSLQATLWVDRQLGLSFGALGWAQLMRILPGLIASADPALAAERAAEQRARRHVYVGDHADGGSMLFARVDTEDAIAFEHDDHPDREHSLGSR